MVASETAVGAKVKTYPRFTFWLLRVQQFASLLGIFGLVLMAISGQAGDPFRLAALAFLLLAMMFGIGWVAQLLSDGKKSGWNAAIVFSCMALPSILFPLAVAALFELFNQELRDRYISIRTRSNGMSSEQEIVYLGRSSKKQEHSSIRRIVMVSMAVVASILCAVLSVGESTPARLKQASFILDPTLTAQELYNLGARCNTTGNLACSKAAFGKLVQLHPADQTILANLAMAEHFLGEHELAIEHFKRYFDRGGRAVDSMAYYAQSLRTAGFNEEALKWYANALNEDSRLVDVTEHMISLLSELGRHEEALSLLDRFVEKNPTAKKMFENMRRTLREKTSSEMASAAAAI